MKTLFTGIEVPEKMVRLFLKDNEVSGKE